MCTYYYLHHHHIPPCTRPVDIVVHYVFCAGAPTPVGTAATDGATVEGAPTGQQTPCERLFYDLGQSVDYDEPCASGGCLVSPDCSSGACRLEQLNGRWLCCQCSRGGNVYRWCCHPMKKSPDTFCYHVCCGKCQPDPADEPE